MVRNAGALALARGAYGDAGAGGARGARLRGPRRDLDEQDDQSEARPPEEAHHVLRCAILLRQIEVLIKERRALRSSVILAGQDMLALPAELLSLSGLMVMHRNPSGDNLRHYVKAHPKWRYADLERVAGLPDGRVYALSTSGLYLPEMQHFMDRPRPVDIRDRVSQHGGHTRTVV